ncbi:MAG: hypothetical protein GF383_08830 [Candidatus Lokiarchaeota archaeon]|nr:hypothetical protein [Candidatus Lokiarchaeota archaeon]MBD3340488.1 hypothetical protein [Candidatus Lokiarchaeota archaeon]
MGITIISKYFRYKTREFLLVGFAWMGLASPWVPEIIEMFILITGPPVNNELVIFIYLLINIAILPFYVIAWLIATISFLGIKKNSRSIIMGITYALTFLFEILIFYFFYTNRILIGEFSGPFLIEWSLFIEIFFIICIAFF